MGKYDHPSSGDLEHQKFLFEAPDKPCHVDSDGIEWDYADDRWNASLWGEMLWEYMEWLEWRVDDLAAHNRINCDSKAYYIEENKALKSHLKKMTEAK